MNSEDFLRTVFGSNEGFLFLSGKEAPSDTEITVHKAFKYPESMPTILKYIAMREDEDLYFSPMLFGVPRRRQLSVTSTSALYADTDTFPVENYLIPPSINIETSPGRHASLWLLDQEYDPKEVAQASRAIALTHASTDTNGVQAGTDPGGWDLTQLLRMPNSMNLKYAVKNKYNGYTEPYHVFVDDDTSPLTIYSLADITAAYDPANLPAMPERVSKDMPDLEALPELKDVLRRVMSSHTLSGLYERKAEFGEDRSQVLYRFVCECLRAGFSAEETFVVGWYAQSNKYRIDGRPRDDFWANDILHGLADPENRPRPTLDAEADDSYMHPVAEGISTQVEFALLEEDEFPTKTFIDEYVAWASAKTDAPTPYHIASALTILSCVLGGLAVAPPKYGNLNLGLSFVIMGETTATRKSTAREMMKSLIRALQDDDHQYILTSDATEEALIDALTERPDITSLYDRDEAQKLIADVKGGKGYMRGFLETLNELYDGHARGRLRAGKATKEARVIFVQYLMGIRSQIQDNLELSDFASGWGPRNIYVRGESPPRTRENSTLEQQNKTDSGFAVDKDFERLVAHLRRLREAWERKCADPALPYKMFFDEDAWDRMKSLEFDLLEFFETNPRIDTLTPCLQRLFTNCIKVATLFGMAENRKSVSLQDVINTRFYAARWVEDLLIMVDGVSESLYARDVRNLEKWIAAKGGVVTNASALSWSLDNGKNYQEHREMVKVLEDRNVITTVEDAKHRVTLKLVDQ